MLNCIKKFLCAALLGGALIFGSGAVEAGIVTDRFPLTCYADHRINTFDGINGRQVGYIDANVDWITITEYRDGWVKASYNGLRNPQNNPRWFRVTEVCADPNYSNRSVNVRGSQTVYTTRSSNTKMGSVSNNESVIVMAEVGNRAQILYRLDNGTGYKMGWVPSSAIPSRNTQPVMPSNPLVQPVSRYATIKDGWYKISPLHTPNKLLDVNAASTAVGANIQLWDNASNVSQPNQVFYLKNLGNNWFTLKAGHCDLNVAAANTSGSLRTNIQLASPNSNSAAQRWRLVVSGTNGAYYIESAIRDKLAFDCEGAGSGNGTNIWLWEHGDVNWNKWRFTPVSAPQTGQPSSSGLKGDVNGDGRVNQSDADQLLAYLRGQTQSINRNNSDVNGDRSINIMDVQALLNQLRSNPQPASTIDNTPKTNAQRSPSGLIYPMGSRHHFSGKNSANKDTNHDHTRNGCCTQGGLGIKLYAICDGEVRYYSITGKKKKNSAEELVSYGNVAYFVGDNGIGAVYAHLSSFGEGYSLPYGYKSTFPSFADTLYSISRHQVGNPRRVRGGDIIGAIGESGNADGAHLHFELYRNASFTSAGKVTGTRVEPNDYFDK